jgi:hypothetical protein
MSRSQHPGPPATYTAYRVVLICVLGVGLFVLGLVVFPGLVGMGRGLLSAIEYVFSFEWDPL